MAKPLLVWTGCHLDGDGDNEPGGESQGSFRTLPLTLIPGTEVFGTVRDSQTQQPIEGITITLEAFPEISATTNAEGFFELGAQDLNGDGVSDGLPAPEFFVSIDGSSAVGPAGIQYAGVGRSFESVPGQRTQLQQAGNLFDIFLPAIPADAGTTIVPGQPTDVSLSPTSIQDLAATLPGVDPSTFDLLQLTIPADAALDESGQVATEAFIVPVDPQFLPAPLPPNLNPDLVVSIQTVGGDNFDVPAPITFPNLSGALPGEQVLLFSFDNDSGTFLVNGTATVSEDGLSITSDPGSGITEPGWHFVQPGTPASGGASLPSSPSGRDPRLPPLAAGGQAGGVATSPEAFAETAENAEMAALSIEDFLTNGPPMNPEDQLALLRNFAEIGAFVNELAGLGGRLRTIITGSTSSEQVFIGEELLFDVAPGLIEGGRELLSDLFGSSDAGEAITDDVNNALESLNQAEAAVQNDAPLVNALSESAEEVQVLLEQFDGAMDSFGVDEATIERVGELFQVISDTARELSMRDRPALDVLSEGLNQAIDVFTTSSAQTVTQQSTSGVLFEGETVGALAINPQGSFTQPSNADVLIETESGIQIRTRTDGDGEFSAVLPPNTPIQVTIFDMLSNTIGTVITTTGASGTPTFLGEVVIASDENLPDDDDNLSNAAELVLGTSPFSADTDGDGISDGAEIEQGLDPLNGLSFPTGIIASLPLSGSANEIVVEGGVDEPGVQTGRLHGKLRWKQHFLEVVFVPSGHQAFVLHSTLGRLFLFEQA